MSLSNSDKRSLRTLFHGLVALLLALPTILPLLEGWLKGTGVETTVATAGATLMVWAAIVSKVINKLEDIGVIPGWLKGNDVLPPTDTPAVDPVDSTPDVVDPVADVAPLGTASTAGDGS